MAQYKEFIGKHKGETIIVCGCGSSLKLFKNPSDFITIGVNDVGRAFTPNYLVILNNFSGFFDDRWKYVKGSKADWIFSHIHSDKLGIARAKRVVNFRLGSRSGVNIDNFKTIDYSSNSPYVACIIAYQMGAKRIGLIGVDFTPNHFFKNTGNHPLIGAKGTGWVSEEYKKLEKAMADKGVELFNLSPESNIQIQKKNFKDL